MGVVDDPVVRLGDGHDPQRVSLEGEALRVLSREREEHDKDDHYGDGQGGEGLPSGAEDVGQVHGWQSAGRVDNGCC